MEIKLLKHSGLVADSILSIRAGTVRRQASLPSGRPFRFPTAETEIPLKIDILKQVGTAYLVQKPGQDQYRVEFSGDDLNQDRSIDIQIKSTAEGVGAARARSEGEEVDEKGTSDGKAAAKDYLDRTQVLSVIQAVLQVVIKTKPADPFAYIAKQLTCGYGPADAGTPRTPTKEDPTAAPEVPASPDSSFRASGDLRPETPEAQAAQEARRALEDTIKSLQPELERLRPKETVRVFMSHTQDSVQLSGAVEGCLIQAVTSVNMSFWDMGRIAPGSGSAGDPAFNEQILRSVSDCDIMVGICDARCKDSHPKWGCPSEWKMALESSKKVFIIAIEDELEIARQNDQVKDIFSRLEFIKYSKTFHRDNMLKLSTAVQQYVETLRSG